MCDKLAIPTPVEPPEFVYKVVQRVHKGRYVTSVMGHPLYLGRTSTARKIPSVDWHCYSDLYQVTPTLKGVDKTPHGNSAGFRAHHSGFFAVFADANHALNSTLVRNHRRNGKNLTQIVLKCVPSGKCFQTHIKRGLIRPAALHTAPMGGVPGFLCEKLLPIEEVGEVVFP